MTTGPQDPAKAGRDRLRAGHADREQVIDALKTAFVHGRLTKDELDTRAGQALSAQTCAELAALTADIPAAPAPPAPAPAGPARARRRPLVRAAATSGTCLVFAFAVLAGGNPDRLHDLFYSWPQFSLVATFWVVLAALWFAVFWLITWDPERSGRQSPPRPGPEPGGRARRGHRDRSLIWM